MRLNGRIYETIVATAQRRERRDLYHSALGVRTDRDRYVIEMAPVRDGRGDERGVVAEGAVGARWAVRFRVFRYEIRRWPGGQIPDLDEAVESPRRLDADPMRILALVPEVPVPVWGRDELQAGEMWNSNSLVSWLLVRAGLAVETVMPPAGGRAPGWDAGIVVARRS